MSDLQKFRIYFGKRPATEEELAGVEEITVEQETDIGRGRRPSRSSLCLDERGNWQHAQDDFLQALKRVRIELQLGAQTLGRAHRRTDRRPRHRHGFAAGPQQLCTLTVQDDSVLLNREAAVDGARRDRTTTKWSHALFGRVAARSPKSASRSRRRPATVSHRLAPGAARRFNSSARWRAAASSTLSSCPARSQAEASAAFFPIRTKRKACRISSCSATGATCSTCRSTEEFQTPTRFRARTLTITDKQIVSRTSRFQDLDLLGPKPAQPAKETATQVLPPDQNNDDDPARAVQAAAQRYELYAERERPRDSRLLRRGSQAVPARDDPRRRRPALSGDYLLTKVTHRITPSLYTQEFSAKRNAVEEPGKEPDLLRGIV